VSCASARECVAVDSAGNGFIGSATASPVIPAARVTITSARINKKHQQARFTFTAAGSGGFQCSLIRTGPAKTPKPHFTHCTSPKFYVHLMRGGYTFVVRVLNTKGAQPSTATKTFGI
jgi:hypothetical protein